MPFRFRDRFRPARTPEDLAPGEAGPTPNMVTRPFVEPLEVVDLEALPAEPMDDERVRVTFWVNVRDGVGARCFDVAVDARLEGPERVGEGMAHTDEYGQVRFRMTGPPGRYRCEITGVGAGAFEVTRRADGRIASAETDAQI